MPTSEQTADTSVEEVPVRAARTSFVRANAVTIGLLLTALILAGIIWFAVPHQHKISSLWLFLFELTPFLAAAGAIAWLDVDWARRLRLHLVVIPAAFLAMFCFFVPRIFYYAGRDGDQLYYHMLTLVPLIILSLCLSYRLGGGTRTGTLRLGGALLLLQLSGLEDLAYILVNPHTDPKWQHVPDVWTWAYHMSVFIGHAPTKYQAYAFITVHVVLALLVLFLPGRAVAPLLRRNR
ncbi:hypothetical protein [Actinoallomurus sp. NPDC050550]|uniref:hypothetical protein n=1 Tax=Actinoallomurus sp. NPDC050550 TaxID=3154937 RepID=UPI0033C3CBB3